MTAVIESFIAGRSVASRRHYDNIDPSTGRSSGPVAAGEPRKSSARSTPQRVGQT